MKKIPTLFQRTPDRRQVIDAVTPGCEWVLAGEGVATRKWDGTCCLVRDGKLYKRREIREGDTTPADFEEVGSDPETKKRVGWVPVGDGPEDMWHREAFKRQTVAAKADGTYELVGPKINGNADKVLGHMLIRHGEYLSDFTGVWSFESVKRELEHLNWEGFVWWHPDGRMAKIKRRDFGLPWPVRP